MEALNDKLRFLPHVGDMGGKGKEATSSMRAIWEHLDLNLHNKRFQFFVLTGVYMRAKMMNEMRKGEK